MRRFLVVRVGLAVCLWLGASACSPYVCDQSTCIGCCMGSTCYAGKTATICGRLGEACQTCTTCSLEGICTGPKTSDAGR